MQKMRKMKDSGIEWIGESPEGWEIKYFVQLFSQVKNKNIGLREKNLLSLSYGKIKQKSIETVGGLLPDNFEGYNIIDRNDIVLRLTDLQNDQHSLRVGLSHERGIITSAYCSIRVRGAESPNYLYYYLHTFDIAKGFYGMGSGVRQGLNWDGLKYIKILLPPQHEQDRISVFLNQKTLEIDSMLSKTISSIEEYKKLKQAVITQAVTEGTPAMFSSPHSVKLKYLISIVSGEAIRNEQLSDFGEYPVYGGGEIIGFCSQYNTSEGSLIIGRVGARCGCVTHTTCKSWATDNALIVLPTCNAKYMYYVIGHCQLNNLNTSNAQPLITSTKIKNVVVSYFSDAMQQQEITDYLDAKCAEIDGLITRKEQLVKELESYKKSLIYEVVTGKREV